MVAIAVIISSLFVSVYAQTTMTPPSSMTPYSPPTLNYETSENEDNIYVNTTYPYNDTSRIITNLTWYRDRELGERFDAETNTWLSGRVKIAEPLSEEKYSIPTRRP